MDASKYSAIERIRDGRNIEIRALKWDDRDAFGAAVRRTSAQSLYRRFFGPKRDFSEKEVAFYVNVDFINHVALVAVAEESGQSVVAAGARYIVQRPGTAELAFVVTDQYQGQGIGAALLRHLAIIGRDAGLNEFIAEVLPENAPMLKVFEKSGLKSGTKRERGVVHVVVQLF